MSKDAKEESVLDDYSFSAGIVPFVEKYRPQTLGEVVSHTGVIKTLQNLIEKDHLPHLLFYGPPGTGKTSTILAISKQINGPQRWKLYTLHLNASDERGIDMIRSQIIPFARDTIPFISKDDDKTIKPMKFVVLDEADSMTMPAMLALRRVIEMYTATVRFCFVANYASKIPEAIQSRCSRFRFGPLGLEDVMKRVTEVASKEQIRIQPDAVRALAHIGKGDMRQTLALLENCASNNGMDEKSSPISTTMIYAIADKPSPQHIESWHSHLMRDTYGEAVKFVQNFQCTHSYALNDIITGLYERLLERPIFSSQTLGALIDRLAMIEYALAVGANETLQQSALVAAYIFARETIKE